MIQSMEKIINGIACELNDKVHTPILVGGWAVNQLGYARNTLDFDFMIFEDEYLQIEKALKKVSYLMAVKTNLYARFESKKNEALPYIDCLFANESTYDKLLSSGTQTNIFNLNLILPNVLHLIAMKLHAVKHGEQHRMDKDFNDIVSLIEIHHINTSSGSEFAALCEKYASHETYTRIKNATKKK